MEGGLTPSFGYLRVSDPSQLKGDGFNRQRAAIEEHAEKNGLRIVQWFEERGLTGKTEWENRPAWTEMMGALNGTRTIVIEKLDRLARQLLVQEHIILDLKKRGVCLMSSAEPDLDSDDPTRVLMRQIMGAIAQFDRAQLCAKMNSAKARIRATGARCEGRKPFGHTAEEKEILTWMQEGRRAGNSFEAMAKALNSGGRVTRYGKSWNAGTICKILSRTEPRGRAV